jgi:hypothetical protein
MMKTARAGLVAGVLDRALLHAGDAARHADDDARLGEVPALVHLLDEVAQHPLGGVEVGDDAVAQRPDRHDVRRACGRSSAWPRCRPATIPPVVVSIATTLGSLSTIPRPRTYTSVLRCEVDRQVTAEERPGGARRHEVWRPSGVGGTFVEPGAGAAVD